MLGKWLEQTYQFAGERWVLDKDEEHERYGRSEPWTHFRHLTNPLLRVFRSPDDPAVWMAVSYKAVGDELHYEDFRVFEGEDAKAAQDLAFQWAAALAEKPPEKNTTFLRGI